MLHFTIESRSPHVVSGHSLHVIGLLGSRSIPTLRVPESERGKPLDATFEAVADGLQNEPGVFWEPDGSFVWTVQEPRRARWEGQVADGATTLQHIELFGSATQAMLDRLLQIVRGPDSLSPLMFQLIRSGVFVEEAAIRQLLY